MTPEPEFVETTNRPPELTFSAAIEALLLLWRRDYPGQRLICDDGSRREFMLPEYEGGPYTIGRTEDPPSRAAPLAYALVQLLWLRSEASALQHSLKKLAGHLVDQGEHLAAQSNWYEAKAEHK